MHYNIKFSIIIPVYNKEKYISKCIKSVLNQTYENIEVIIVDDGSTDKSKHIILDLIKGDSRFKYNYQGNSGCSTARNKGIKISTGEYILFLDADDTLTDNRVMDSFNILNNEKYDLIQNAFFHNGKITEYSYFIPAVWNKTFYAETIKKNRIYFPTDTHMGEDLAFVLKYICFSNKKYFSPNPIYYYEINNDSVMNISDLQKKLEIFKSLEDVILFYKKNNIEVSKQKLVKHYMIQYGINSVIDNILVSNISLSEKYFRFMEIKKEIECIAKEVRYNFIYLRYVYYLINRKIRREIC